MKIGRQSPSRERGVSEKGRKRKVGINENGRVDDKRKKKVEERESSNIR